MKKTKITSLYVLLFMIINISLTAQISFINSGQLLGDSNSKGVTLGDLDNDGDLDAFVANFGNNKIWLNDGKGIFVESEQFFDSTNTYSIILFDVDNDSDLDAIEANQSNNVLWINDGKAVFEKSNQEFGDYDTPHFDFGDLNNDGFLDIFITNFTLPGFTGFAPIEILFNDGKGNFTSSGQKLQGLGSRDVELADYDGDGDLDAFITNHFEHINNIKLGNGNPPNQLYLNDGNGHFTDSGQIIGNSVSDYVKGADVDNDGDIDLFVANSFSENYLWLNDGKGNFTIGQQIDAQARNISFSDLDNDEDFDLVIIKSSGENSVWVNDGSGKFIKEYSFDTNKKNLGLDAGDLDNDNDIDLFITVATKGRESKSNILFINNSIAR